jgi:hypothetical protein
LGLAVFGNQNTRAVAHRGIATSTAVWFTFDTGFRLIAGEVEYATFNLPFVSLLAAPLYIMSNIDMQTKKTL